MGTGLSVDRAALFILAAGGITDETEYIRYNIERLTRGERMDLTILKRMVNEVADDTLAVLLAESAGKFTIGDDEQLRTVDVIVAELKRRHGIVDDVVTKSKRNYKAEAERRKSKKAGEVKADDGSIRTESGQL